MADYAPDESNFQIIWDENITDGTTVKEMSFEEFYDTFGIDARALDDSFEVEHVPTSMAVSDNQDMIQEEMVGLSVTSDVPPQPEPEKDEFVQMSIEDVNATIKGQANKNTSKKTEYDLKKFERFLKFKKETRPINEIDVDSLDEYMANFLLSIRKSDGEEYQPTSVRGFISSFDRELKRLKYPYTVAGQNGPQFALTRSAFTAKTKLLKKSGKGNKPKAAGTLTDDEINTLFAKGLLGDSSPQALLNTVWLNNCVHFGLRGTTENYNLRWGDITRKQLPDGTEYLELNERQTKTRTGENISDVRKVTPKMFANNGDRDPVKFYKVYESKRPSQLCQDDDPFYIAPRTKPLDPENPNCQWFINQRVGVKKLGSLMKKMSEEAGLAEAGKRLTNHSARKHLVQKLRDANVPPTEIIQISGHKNVQSVLNYSGISETKQKECSYLLSNQSATSSSASLSANATQSICTDPCCRPSVNQNLVLNPNPEGIAQVSSGPFMDLTARNNSVENLPSMSVGPVGVPQGPSQLHQKIDTVSVSETNSLNSQFFGAVFHIQNFNVYHK